MCVLPLLADPPPNPMDVAFSDLTRSDQKLLLKLTAKEMARDLKEECEGLTEIEVAGLLRVDPRTVRERVPFKEIKPGVRRYPRSALMDFLNS